MEEGLSPAILALFSIFPKLPRNTKYRHECKWGKRLTLIRADLIDAEPDCECGMDHTASVREEIVIQLLDEEHEAHHHPGRYWHPPKGRRNTLLASLGEPKLRKS